MTHLKSFESVNRVQFWLAAKYNNGFATMVSVSGCKICKLVAVIIVGNVRGNNWTIKLRWKAIKTTGKPNNLIIFQIRIRKDKEKKIANFIAFSNDLKNKMTRIFWNLSLPANFPPKYHITPYEKGAKWIILNKINCEIDFFEGNKKYESQYFSNHSRKYNKSDNFFSTAFRRLRYFVTTFWRNLKDVNTFQRHYVE